MCVLWKDGKCVCIERQKVLICMKRFGVYREWFMERQLKCVRMEKQKVCFYGTAGSVFCIERQDVCLYGNAGCVFVWKCRKCVFV